MFFDSSSDYELRSESANIFLFHLSLIRTEGIDSLLDTKIIPLLIYKVDLDLTQTIHSAPSQNVA